jgi:uncharacterized membrane-anchored protein
MTPHPARARLHDEIHARPRPPVTAPHAVSHISVLQPRRLPRPTPAALVDWCVRHAVPPPAPGQAHFDAELGAVRFKWERHGEFDDYTVYAAGCDPARPFARSPADTVLDDLARGLDGELVAALRIAVLGAGQVRIDEGSVSAMLEAPEFTGAKVADGQASLFSAFRLDHDGFGRFLLVNGSAQPAELGRVVQRVIDLDVYRMMAMLAFPEAGRIGAELDRVGRRLTDLVGRLDVAPASEEPEMLHELTQLSAIAERLAAEGHFRFGAARAYASLVARRSGELRESRLPGLQPPTGFLARRFEPAMATCEATAARLASVSERIARASGLLRTRVEIERERQNQALLAAMNRRAELQLHLQQTVEGLSVAAITYYATGLAGYLFKAGEKAGLPIQADLATGLAVVPIVLAVALAIRAIRRRVGRALHEPTA